MENLEEAFLKKVIDNLLEYSRRNSLMKRQHASDLKPGLTEMHAEVLMIFLKRITISNNLNF